MSNAKKYTVKDFCKKYNGANVEQAKEALVKSVMNSHYVSYEMKVTICEKIVENSYYKIIEKNGIKTKKLHVNSPAKYILYWLNLVKQYTNIEIDFSKSLEEFNLLNKDGLLDVLCSLMPEREIKEFRMILDMVESDVVQNEYESHAFISNQIERFGELFGVIANPALERLIEIAEGMDENTIDKIMNKLQGLNGIKGKFNIMK